MKPRFNLRNNNQPAIRVGRTLEGTIFEIIAAVLIVIMWVVTFILWSRSPESVPTHFGVTGTADAYGNRSAMLIMAAVGTLVTVIMLVSAYSPSKTINMPVNVRTPRQFMIVIRMTRILAVITPLLFTSIACMMAYPDSQLAFIFLMVCFVSMIAVAIYSTVKVGRAKNG